MTAPVEPVLAPPDAQLPEQVAVVVPPEGASEQELLAALVSAMIAGAALEVIRRILGRFVGLTPRLVETILRVMMPQWQQLLTATASDIAAIPRDDSDGSKILRQLATVNAYRRAAYLVNALRRMAPAALSGEQEQIERAAAREERYLAAHDQAEHNRNMAAASVIETTATSARVNQRGEPLLGWQAVLDERTTPECRAAHGRNFNPTVRPRIGYPGEVHIHCRCRARRPWKTSKRVETIGVATHD